MGEVGGINQASFYKERNKMLLPTIRKESRFITTGARWNYTCLMCL